MTALSADDFNVYPCKSGCGETVDVYWDVTLEKWCYPVGIQNGGYCEACREEIHEKDNMPYWTDRANLTKAELGLTLASFIPSAATQEVYDAARRMVLGERINLFMSGKAGRGKTHIAVGVVLGRIKNKVRFLPVTRWLMEVRSTIKDTGEDFYINKFLEYDCIVLDDFGANKLTDWNLSFLDCLIDEWYRRRRGGLIVTSNFSLKEVSEKISDRIASRLDAMCEVYELEGHDHRINPKDSE